MSRRKKEEIRKILSARDLDALDDWSARTRSPLRVLFTLTYEDDPLLRYRAIEAIGRTAAAIAGTDVERVRVFIRGQIWLMTEESGGIGWHSPETIAEVCLRVPQIHEEYAKMLPQFLEEEFFAPSTCAALYKLLPLPPGFVGRFVPLLETCAESDRPHHTYDSSTGTLSETTVGELARLVLKETA
jgi:hypothetical protein